MNLETAIHSSPHWMLLTVIGVALVVAEIFVPGFVMLPIGLGFLLTGAVAAFTSSWVILLAVLIASELGVYWLFQTKLKRLIAKPRAYTAVEGMIGAECDVVEEITSARPGYVKLYGDTWQAKCATEASIPVGARVVITRMEGNKAHVERVE